jgi:hypothetical protein
MAACTTNKHHHSHNQGSLTGKLHPHKQLLQMPIVNAFDELQVISIIVKLKRSAWQGGPSGKGQCIGVRETVQAKT